MTTDMKATDVKTKQQIYQMIERLPGERLPDLLRLLRRFSQPDQSDLSADTTLPPIYQISQYAVDTGIPDLAVQHDHYLYGTDKRDA
jgi:hypothetical protein